MPSVFRFAPSPNGYLHLGHAYSALLNFRLTRESGGRLLLRIEDIDSTRCRPEFEAAIYEDLAWLGIAWETPVRRQSEHFSDYRAALERLSGMGLVYPSFESRAELIESGAPYALRLDMVAACARAGELGWTERGEGPDGESGAVAARPQAWGDVILARKETPTSYHLSVVIDDSLQGVTEVVRGVDLFRSTSVHRLLQALLGLREPCYRHHRLVLDDGGRKLSKSTAATGLRELRAAGATPADIGRAIGLP
jgi:glutamyl-Q tRNA(Asp) synthetase